MSELIEGQVLSLHLHPETAGAPFRDVSSLEVHVQKGIVGNSRYYARRGRDGQPSRRQISLIEREQIQEHARALGESMLAPGLVRANVETSGLNLVSLVGQQIEIGEALLFITMLRDPCRKMDAVHTGLRALMENGHQGVLAQILRAGQIRVGDSIRPIV